MSKTKKRPAKAAPTILGRWLAAGQSLNDKWAAARFDAELASSPTDGAYTSRRARLATKRAARINAAISAIIGLSPEVAAQFPAVAADVLRVAERLRKPGPNAIWFAENWPDIAAGVKAAAIQQGEAYATAAKSKGNGGRPGRKQDTERQDELRRLVDDKGMSQTAAGETLGYASESAISKALKKGRERHAT